MQKVGAGETAPCCSRARPETVSTTDSTIPVDRLSPNPLIVSAMSHSVGDNINGRSVIPVLTGLGNPFGQYFMYFAHPVEKPQGPCKAMNPAHCTCWPWHLG
jgi:hypothetical protein